MTEPFVTGIVVSESSIELFPRHAWSLFARTNTFVNRLLLCFCPGEFRIQQPAKALLLVGPKLWQLFNDLLEARAFVESVPFVRG
jgi:hypothetical protein